MSFKKIDQKEYLKKYLSGDKQKKKKKKNKDKDQHRSHQEKVKIIDDDLHAPENVIDDELYGEDAPQIVGEFTEELASGNDKKCKWRSIAIKEEAYDKKYNQYESNGHSVSDSKKIAPQSNANLSPDRKFHKTKTRFPDDSDCHKKISRTGGSSKERRKQKDGDSHIIRSPSRRTYRSHSRENSQHKVSSFQLQNQTRSTLPVKRCSLSPDQSPPRKKSHVFESHKSQSKTSETYVRSSSGSPKHRTLKNPLHQPDLSPQRMQTSHKLIRSKRNDNLEARKSNTITTFPNSPIKKEKNEDSDLSPPRRVGEDSDLSPPRRVGEQLSLFDNCSRRNRSSLHVKREELSLDSSPQRKSYSSKQRRSRWASPERRNSQSLSPPPTHKPKISSKTLDGKRAGLQDSKALKTEMNELRRQEELMIANMPSELSGRNGEVQVRNTRRRGERARNAAIEDTDKQRQKDAHEKYKQELYDRWGKGLKQIEDFKSRMAEIDYESNKPFARHRDDEDLDRHLREKEHPDDPMLEYMRQKRKEREKKESLPKIPVYEGSYPENRFGIRPGYRWDGVDRSNGYEKKWFDMQNAKRALRDEAYKYSVEDM